MSNDVSTLSDKIDFLSRSSGLGSLSESVANTVMGINHRGVGNPVMYNQDNQGLTFFTRPRMNLSYNNISIDRRLSIMGSASNGKMAGSYQSAIRRWLDPDLAKTLHDSGNRNGLVDPKQAFIPLLTNNLISLSGWPDPVAEYYTAPAGLAKETWSMVDGIDTIYSEYSLNASFRNIAGDPISLMFQSWLIYMSLVYQGKMLPYPDSEMLREIDYQTRIYRLVLDPKRKYVQKIAACGACFPTTSALGQAFDFSADTPFEQSRASQISISFQAVGAMYQDPILMQEFNDVVGMFNPNMLHKFRSTNMVKLSDEELLSFNYSGYPRINMDTNELEWWEEKDAYKTRLLENSKAKVATPVPSFGS